MKQSNWVLLAGVIVALLLITGTVFFKQRQSPATKQETYHAPSLNKKITTLPLLKLEELLRNYTGRL